MSDDRKLVLRKARLVRRFWACSENLRCLNARRDGSEPKHGNEASEETFIKYWRRMGESVFAETESQRSE